MVKIIFWDFFNLKKGKLKKYMSWARKAKINPMSELGKLDITKIVKHTKNSNHYKLATYF